MYTKIALILLGFTVSVGAALAVVLAQNSSVKRPLGPEVANLSSEISVKPRIEQPLKEQHVMREAVQSAQAPLAATRPVMRPLLKPLSEDFIASLQAETPGESPADLAPQTEIVARAPVAAAPLAQSTSEPSTTPFSRILDSLQPAPQPQTRALGLVEQPHAPSQKLAETWAIGVYR